MSHSDPIILTLSVCKGEGAVVHLSLLFTAGLHFSLFGGAFISLRPIHVMDSQLQDNFKSVIVKIGLHLSYPVFSCSFLRLIILRNHNRLM